MPEDFARTVRATLAAAQDHAARLSDLPEREHRRLCEQLEARVVAVFNEAQAASQGFLRFHRKLDANGSAMIYGLSVQRDAYTKTCLFVRVDVLAAEDQDAFLEARVLDLIWTLREASTSHRSRF